MTRRERMEAELQKRQDWAEGRHNKANALIARNEPCTSDYAFNTQPGHIPERARVIAREDKAMEHAAMAAHHEQKAASIERQLERSIFSDDEDAPERLRERIEELRAEADSIKAYNASCRNAAKTGGHGDLSLLSDKGHADVLLIARVCAYQLRAGWALPAYASSNLGANIRRLEGRLAQIVGSCADVPTLCVETSVLIDK